MAASSSSSSRISRSLDHDVFLSFCGADTRNGFTSHLFAALYRQGISTFRDDTKLPRGENIGSELIKAIEESRVLVVIFSRNYAASTWCLDELVKIIECRRNSNSNQFVLPIFYDVDPSEVRAQLGSYSEAFAKHEDRVNEGSLSMGRMERWRFALKEAADLSGYHLQHGDETKVINKVVEDIGKRLDTPYFHVADYPVGIETREEILKALLRMRSDGVSIVAIWGDGGIGKTTIAKAVFNCICKEFEGCSFLADVSENTKSSPGVVTLQKQLLRDILMTDTCNFDNKDRGIEVIKHKLCHRRVLLVLDDVDNVQQLKNLGVDGHTFGSGSKIIITTRNESSIMSLQVDSVYSPEYLDEGESLKLFSWNAFKTDHPRDGYWELSKEVVAYAKGLPLALEVLGSYLSGRSEGEWQSAVEKLKIVPNADIHGKLKLSFDSLDDIDKELFLDIAFFFIGKDKDFVVKVLEEDSESFPVTGITELARRCLVRIDWRNKIWMHDLVRGMGREIVRTESLKEPGERSRLWHTKEILKVLAHYTGTKGIEGICLELPAENSELVNVDAFANMSNLRLLHLNHLKHLRYSYNPTFRRLKWLCWHGFPFTYISADLYMENLVAIDLQYSNLKQVWKGPKRLGKLKFLNLSHSYDLTKTPDFSGMKSLERLLLNDCTSLVKVHNSIGYLDKLHMLSMSNCINLSKVPLTCLLMLKSLEKLDCSGCFKLGELAESIVQFSILRQQLTARQNYIPSPLTHLHGLSCIRKLNLKDCNLEYLPSEIGSLTALVEVNISGNNFCSIPSSFSHLACLRRLKLNRCFRLKSLVNLPNNLMVVTANNCISLETGSEVGCIKRLEYIHCPKLNGKSLCDDLKRSILGLCEGGLPGPCRTLIFTGGEIPYDMQFQGMGSKSLSFVVPSLVGKKIIGFIAYSDYSYYMYPSHSKLLNKSMGKNARNYYKLRLVSWTGDIIDDGDDELDLIPKYSNGLKSLGLSLIYQDHDKSELQVEVSRWVELEN